jgi:hypothetical protein
VLRTDAGRYTEHQTQRQGGRFAAAASEQEAMGGGWDGMEGGINRQKTVQAAFFWGWLVGSLCASRFCDPFSRLLFWPSPLPVLLALCVSRLILVSPGCTSVLPDVFRSAFSLLCPRFTVPEYYCSRARWRPRLASSQSGTDPALSAARRIVSQAQIQCSCGRPRLCLYKLD